LLAQLALLVEPLVRLVPPFKVSLKGWVDAQAVLVALQKLTNIQTMNYRETLIKDVHIYAYLKGLFTRPISEHDFAIS
jgi:hypothetical protein